VETCHGMRSTGRWLGRFFKTVGAASGGAPTPGMAPTMAMVAGAPPIGDRLAQEGSAQWLNSGGVTFQWQLSFGVSRGHRGGVYIGKKCIVRRRDSKAVFITDLIISLMIIGRIQNGIEMSSLRSKILLWFGVHWPYGLGTSPRAGGGGT
jgi:hypothetical protein